MTPVQAPAAQEVAAQYLPDATLRGIVDALSLPVEVLARAPELAAEVASLKAVIRMAIDDSEITTPDGKPMPLSDATLAELRAALSRATGSAQ